MTFVRRLIEVDLPIRAISAHARREKSIRHGHISTLHIWWARRPLAACRAVICASLWPDPADALCPPTFRDAAVDALDAFAQKIRSEKVPEWQARWRPFDRTLVTPETLRHHLLDFIADFANWDASTVAPFLECARALTDAAHVALGGEPGTRPLVVDPFAGGGAIPLEALRVGADAFASDLNPVAVLLNKVVLEYIPKYGKRLADEVRKWGAWVKAEAEKELAEFYPKDPDGATPIAYLWARAIRCEGPACGAVVPLVRSLWLSKRRRLAWAPVIDKVAKTIDFELAGGVTKPSDGTVRAGSAICPVCGFTTPNRRVRGQLSERRGGAADAVLLGVVLENEGGGRSYRPRHDFDLNAARSAELRASKCAPLAEPIPTERPSPNARGLSGVTRMGVSTFGDLFSPRQFLVLSRLAAIIRGCAIEGGEVPETVIKACLALVLDRVAEKYSSLTRWDSSPKMETIAGTFGRQALSIVWDFAEQVPFRQVAGSWDGALEWVAMACDIVAEAALPVGVVEQASATRHALPDGAVAAFVTDPPYYDSVPYADLSDYFYVWLRRSVGGAFPTVFGTSLSPKDDEAIWNPSRTHSVTGSVKDTAFYETQMRNALGEGRRITADNGIGVVVFAHKSTSGWEAVLSALMAAGWTATASWPIDTELGNRVNAQGTASLASSVHIVCRPRQADAGHAIGEWRDVLSELPVRLHEWMPRLAHEGVVGADAIFACLGPALEIYSRYARVEKASGEPVLLKEYLEHVWAAVSNEALSLIFDDADATGLEADARLTAMWLWTLKAPTGTSTEDPGDEDETDDDDEAPQKAKARGGFALEYDAARKIAQGLGARLEQLTGLVEVKGETARLLAVAERAAVLLGTGPRQAVETPVQKAKAKGQLDMFGKPEQIDLLGDPPEVRRGYEAKDEPPPVAQGKTTLDRVHQAMLLFGAGRGEALKRFVTEDSAGADPRFWKLCQSLTALYPGGTDEKRWVDGLLARKKGLGF